MLNVKTTFKMTADNVTQVLQGLKGLRVMGVPESDISIKFHGIAVDPKGELVFADNGNGLDVIKVTPWTFTANVDGVREERLTHRTSSWYFFEITVVGFAG